MEAAERGGALAQPGEDDGARGHVDPHREGLGREEHAHQVFLKEQLDHLKSREEGGLRRREEGGGASKGSAVVRRRRGRRGGVGEDGGEGEGRVARRASLSTGRRPEWCTATPRCSSGSSRTTLSSAWSSSASVPIAAWKIAVIDSTCREGARR